MALPLLVNGNECGPSNPLQGLSKRFDNDRGLQQDYFGAGRAGSSRETFRSQPTVPLQTDQDAARFFGQTPQPQFNAYDLGGLKGALPAPEVQQPQQVLMADWAADFLTQQPMQAMQSTPSSMQAPSVPSMAQTADVGRPPLAPWNSVGVPAWGMGMRSTSGFAPINAVSTPRPDLQENLQISWDREFDAQQIDPLPVAGPSNSQKESPHRFQEQDELARTAGLLLETVKTEQNPKFQNSQFMSLMMQLRDRKVVVKGNEMVENDDAAAVTRDSRIDVKGKGRASDLPSFQRAGSSYTHGSTLTSSTASEVERVASYREGPTIQEDANDAYFRQENEDYIRYWNTALKPAPVIINNDLTLEKLQKDWDEFEASTRGIKPVLSYQFQKNNPYLHSDRSRTRHHSMHSDERLETVLELEATVQRNMSDATAWFELGVKQQEQEREMQALQALAQATELDPAYLPGWLALAVSYTNDGRRLEAYDAIRQWVTRNETHRAIVSQHFSRFSETENTTPQEKFSHLVQCLITMAQQSAVGQIDADIQIALAVLFNSNEEYEKAQDCFRAALYVRPDDWQLYNRVGATMANSGHAAEALEYYHRALDLNPAYIRARYNLGISCLNLKRYDEGAQHILDALSLQDAEGVDDAEGVNNARGGITSSALWDSLKTACLHMQRIDLATLCDRRDLEGRRTFFDGAHDFSNKVPSFPF
ncbi:hypothetical protein GYMLUDRAFT_156531 [Collybiopsis luxurians FD-317 M1]|nr:hypothetical protein GYMLUDRAFT_156531 [Collybiopsis luxurians FD-317 M1]